MANIFGKLFTITTWGESHGGSIGVTIDGCPPQLSLSAQDVQTELNRRQPGQSNLTTQRQESDQVENPLWPLQRANTRNPDHNDS